MYSFEHSVLDNKVGQFKDFQVFFEKNGLEFGGGWEYDHGFFDKVLELVPSYLFLRIPVYAVEGKIGDEQAKVRLGTPFLLSHQYEQGINQQADSGIFIQPFLNQFSEPEDADAPLKQEEIEIGYAWLHDLESVFRQHFHYK